MAQQPQYPSAPIYPPPATGYPPQQTYGQPPQGQGYYAPAQPYQQLQMMTTDYKSMDEQEPCFTHVKWWHGLIFFALYLLYNYVLGPVILQLSLGSHFFQ